MEPLDQIAVATLVLVRITSMLMTAPLLGSRAVPVRFRLLLGALLTAMTFPLIQSHAAAPTGTDDWVRSCFSEVTVGISLGLGVMLIYSAVQMAGTVISQMAAIPLGDAMDATGGGAPVGRFFGILSAAAFALINGPELLVTTTLDTFMTLPVGHALDSNNAISLVTELLRQSFLLTLRGVGPAVTAMLLSTLLIGLISRSFPQFNLFGLGLSSNLLIMLIAILFSVTGCVWLFVDDFGSVLELLRVRLSAGGVDG